MTDKMIPRPMDGKLVPEHPHFPGKPLFPGWQTREEWEPIARASARRAADLPEG